MWSKRKQLCQNADELNSKLLQPNSISDKCWLTAPWSQPGTS